VEQAAAPGRLGGKPDRYAPQTGGQAPGGGDPDARSVPGKALMHQPGAGQGTGMTADAAFIRGVVRIFIGFSSAKSYEGVHGKSIQAFPQSTLNQ